MKSAEFKVQNSEWNGGEVSLVLWRYAAPNAIDIPIEELVEPRYLLSEAVYGSIEVPDRHRKANGFIDFTDGADAEDVDGQGNGYPDEQMKEGRAGVVGRRLIRLGCVAAGYAHAVILRMEHGLLEGGSIGVGWR